MDTQLKFNIDNLSLYRLDGYICTEGSENYVHASFDIADDPNLDKYKLVVYTSYKDEIYVVPKNSGTGMYDIPSETILYPGFYVFCRIFNSNVSRYTEKVFVPVIGGDNILKRYIKPTGEYSEQLLSTIYGVETSNVDSIRSLSDRLDNIIIDKTPEVSSITDAELANIIK